ncbi:MAG: HIT family protein [Desulfuromonadaceae bacterium]
MRDTTCIFCEIIAGSEPASKVYEDSCVIAFLDLYPLNPGHTLIVPKFHVSTLDELDESTASHIMKVAQQLVAAMRGMDKSLCTGVNLIMANGASAGQEVFHAHLHLLPRIEKDGIRIGRSARQTQMPRNDLENYAGIIRNAISYIGENQ